MSANEAGEYFLPPERVSDEVVRQQREKLIRIPLLMVFLNGMPDGAAILNGQRQIVIANAALTHALGAASDEALTGKRPGEAFMCVHFKGHEGECGSTGFCRYCGAAGVLLQSRMGKQAADECRIVSRVVARAECEIQAMDLLVWGTPFISDGDAFTFFAICDISHEKRRAVLERLFFHDFLNMAGNVRALAELLMEDAALSLSDLTQPMYQVADSLVHEIRSQKMLLEAERNELAVKPRSVSSLEFIGRMIRFHQAASPAENAIITLDPESERFQIVTDDTLLSRVIGNLIKNAIEAGGPGDAIKVGCRQMDDRGDFWVWNRAFVPSDTQCQFFKRSFSTKGRSRGLGLYSVKLFTENYLQGKVSFQSSPEEGTIFHISLPLDLPIPDCRG